jgi:hypothetical protein
MTGSSLQTYQEDSIKTVRKRLFFCVRMCPTIDTFPEELTLPQSHQETPGYCWPTLFNVLEVLFLGAVSSAFLPSKKACWAHQFGYLVVGQQYPPVISTHAPQPTPGAHSCTETRSRNLWQVGSCPQVVRHTAYCGPPEAMKLIPSTA